MENIIQEIKKIIRTISSGRYQGQDWFHIERVLNLSTKISKSEGTDLFLVQMASILHDTAEQKLVNFCSCDSNNILFTFLTDLGIKSEQALKIQEITNEVDAKPTSLESAVVQDADRLDTIGAVGIARCFANTRMIYNPADLMEIKTSKNKPEGDEIPRSSIANFYDKLLWVKDQMNTAEGKRIAEQRTEFMEMYLDQFFADWNNS